MFRKFEGPFWYIYIQWPNVIDAINNCTVPADSASRWGGRDKTCWNQLDCALTAADASQQQQYSCASTILGLVSLFTLRVRKVENTSGMLTTSLVTHRTFNDGNIK